MLNIGQKVPDFTLPNQNGAPRSAKSYQGKWLVLYVYPKDDTPGCTIQGKAFTETKSRFDQLGVQVVGLSQDDVESHKSFCGKYSLAVELLADPDAKLLSALGVGQHDWNGTSFWDRSTFLIDPSGVVRKVYTNVQPQGHEQMLLDDISALAGAETVRPSA
jgi:thioredoxin-dependent peroxiredoxin